jgi:hypothetical protein
LLRRVGDCFLVSFRVSQAGIDVSDIVEMGWWRLEWIIKEKIVLILNLGSVRMEVTRARASGR